MTTERIYRGVYLEKSALSVCLDPLHFVVKTPSDEIDWHPSSQSIAGRNLRIVAYH
jgi:hypothetical protein